jgi:hypothetical protein
VHKDELQLELQLAVITLRSSVGCAAMPWPGPGDSAADVCGTSHSGHDNGTVLGGLADEVV